MASRSVAVGGSVIYSRLGVGLVNTQHRAHLVLGERVLNRMEEGQAPQGALEYVLKRDVDLDVRQFLAVDAQNRMGIYTGGRCEPEKGHLFGRSCAVAGNMLGSPAVLEAMREAFVEGEGLDLGLRLLRSLEAGESQGGDRRGTRSAAIKVVPPPEPSVAVNLDLRVDDHDEPLGELARLYRAFMAEFDG